jgi:hypothetical protein
LVVLLFGWKFGEKRKHLRQNWAICNIFNFWQFEEHFEQSNRLGKLAI